MDKVQLKSQVSAKMKVEIWSDIMCPFCYIGKRRYETALSQFGHKGYVETVWKSFQLDPTIPEYFDRSVNVYQYLADRKGMSYEQSLKMHLNVVQMAKDAGLEYNFDKAVVANSYKAHRMLQLAKDKGKGDEAEERLFSAYFTEGKDFGSTEVLISLGNDIGLTAGEVTEALTEDLYANRVEEDIQEAREIGVTGVPFFVFNRKYAISGAQPSEGFLQALEKSFAEWRKENPLSPFEFISEAGDQTTGQVCTPEGNCQ